MEFDAPLVLSLSYKITYALLYIYLDIVAKSIQIDVS